MYFVKHRLEKKKILPCNFYSLRKAENFQMIVPFIYIRFELFKDLNVVKFSSTVKAWPEANLHKIL